MIEKFRLRLLISLFIKHNLPLTGQLLLPLTLTTSPGRALATTEEEAYPILESLDVDYVLVVFGGKRRTFKSVCIQLSNF